MRTREIVRRTARSAILSTAIACCLGTLPADALSARTLPRRPAGGSILFVQNCNDSGPGSLRDTVAHAVSGDSVDLAQMGCSLITLTSGAIEVQQDDLTIKYSNTTGRPTISGEYLDRIFHHTGAGTLELDHLVVENGKYAPDQPPIVAGGCIESVAGSVTLNSSLVTRCDLEVVAGSGFSRAAGGGIHAGGSLSLDHSAITYCRVYTADVTPVIYGGGAYASQANISYSTISHNVASALHVGPYDHTDARGGGLVVTNNIPRATSIDHTTISNNAAYENGGLVVYSFYSNATLTDVTIADNSSIGSTGGALLYTAATLRSVTVAGNDSGRAPAALRIPPPLSVNLISTVVAGNSTEDPGGSQIAGAGAISGDHNLVFGPVDVDLPPDTLMTDPLLLPLADNGGETKTMAVRLGSPAIDAGASSDDIQTDQRGSGYVRVVGAAPDIGAFERQGPNDGDYISVGGFDPP